MKKKYQFRVEVGAFEFVFASGVDALSFARSAVEHFCPDKYYENIPINITIENTPEEKPDDVQEGDDD